MGKLQALFKLKENSEETVYYLIEEVSGLNQEIDNLLSEIKKIND